LQRRGLQAELNINRDAAARLGITVATINEALYDAFGQRLVSTIFTQSTQYRIVLEAPSGQSSTADDQAGIYVPSSSGEPVSLSNLARIELKSAMLSVERMGQFPASTISFNLADGMALSDAVEEISRLPQEIGMPGSIDLRYQGAAKAFQ